MFIRSQVLVLQGVPLAARRLYGTRSIAAGCTLLLAACGGEPGGDPPVDRGVPEARRFATSYAVQVGSFADSTNALALRDSLARAGWEAYVRPGAGEPRPLWRVRVAPSAGTALPHFTASALRERGVSAVVVRDSVSAERPPVELVAVNTGGPGMAAGTRWALSPDSRAMIAVEDPAAVENEPHPNGFVFASEAGAGAGYHFQMDSVWDVAPSPDWRRLAVGRAYTVVASGPGGITDAQWEALARRAGLAVDVVRRSAFESSSMNVAFALARSELIALPAAGSTTSDIESRPLRGPGGWRIGWTVDGGAIALGTNPARRADDAPPAAWMAVDPGTLEVVGTLTPDTRLADVEWLEGPVLDISLPIDLRGGRSIATAGDEITSEGGWIRVGGRLIGPGIVLAATRTGRYVLALAPRPGREAYDTPTQLVLYVVAP